MKAVIVALLLTVGWSAATEDIAEQTIQICDMHMLNALQRICEYKDFDYLLQNSQYEPNRHHNHHQHDHSSKSDDDLSISERCCHKPCLVKEFKSFCGDM